MEVYFVRHGETDGNIARRHQHPNTQLNERGREQIKAVAKELAKLPITHFITSTHYRAVESARIIAETCGLTPTTEDIFEEVQRPLELVGNRYVGLTTFWYALRWFYSVKLKDGENYDDFRRRVIAARTYLESLPRDARVVVVSHAVFINIFLDHLCLDERMSLTRAVLSFWRIFRLRNASLVHLQYTNYPNTCGWTILKR